MGTLEDTLTTRIAKKAPSQQIITSFLWDKPLEVLARSKTMSKSSAIFTEFLSKYQKLESEFGASLSTLVNHYTSSKEWEKFSEGPSLTAAWKALLRQAQHQGVQHSKSSLVMKKILEEARTENTEQAFSAPCKQWKEELSRAHKNLSKAESELKKKHNEHVKNKEVCVNELMASGKSVDLDNEKMWIGLLDEKKKEKSERLSAEYRQCQIADHMVRTVYNQTVTSCLDAFQALEFERVAVVERRLLQVAELQSKLEASIYKGSVVNLRLIRSVKKEQDLRLWCSALATTPRQACPWLDEEVVSETSRPAPASGRPAHKREGSKMQQANPFSRVNLKWAGKDSNPNAERRATVAIAPKAAAAAAAASTQEPEDQNQGGDENTDNSGTAAGSTQGGKEDMSVTMDTYLKTPVVIDNGSAYFKCGFAGNRSPAFVIPSAIAHFTQPQADDGSYFAGGGAGVQEKDEYDRNVAQASSTYMMGASALHIGPGVRGADGSEPLSVNNMLFSDQPTSWDDVESMWAYIFSRLQVDPSEHPILLTQPTLAPLSLKTRMEEVLFEKFDAAALYVAEAPLLGAYAYGRSSGLVVDVGHSSAQVLPLVNGYLLEHHVERAKHLGGHRDTQSIVQYFKSHTDQFDFLERGKYVSEAHTHIMAQSIKDRLALCASSQAAYEDEMGVLQDVQGFLGGKDPEEESGEEEGLGNVDEARPHPLTLSKVLLQCGEVNFQPKSVMRDEDDSLLSLPELIRKSVDGCDIDTRRTLLENIFLAGQVTTMPGFSDRLTAELKQCMPHASYIKVYGKERRYATWCGGSVLANLDGFQDSWKLQSDWEELQSGGAAPDED